MSRSNRVSIRKYRALARTISRQVHGRRTRGTRRAAGGTRTSRNNLYRFENCRTFPELQVWRLSLCRLVVLVDHAAENLPAPHRRGLSCPKIRLDDMRRAGLS
jgi:hypothetical protein